MNNNLRTVLHYLEQNGLKLVTAESCTAGLIASILAEEPGSGSWLDCAYVTYSEQAKLRCLGVQQETIARCNLTSEEVSREMAEGALQQSGANVAVAATGLAGPGGQGDIPAGRVCFAWAFAASEDTKDNDATAAANGDDEGRQQSRTKGSIYSETREFDGERNQVRQAAAEYAISRIWHYHHCSQQP